MDLKPITSAIFGLAFFASGATAMPDANTMKRLETVAFYLGAADHCQIDIETERLRAYYERQGALDPVVFGAVDRFVRAGSVIRHQPGSSHCGLTERIMRAEGIID
ncbi:hypothetical protein LC092_17380 [Stappia stellulata]|uniref:hypothetical protein n=1 Tax=Stappia stellulata TaxID=71235 RepID=UPI001CD28626|nr:hypothetical protein [Stappia stellulata]MCA1244219.1 hypothetical protein [Stappia stellulata]